MSKGTTLTPLGAAAFARRLRAQARATTDQAHALVLTRMAATAQTHAVTDDFGPVAA
jgi:hypothetical protein